MSKRKKYSNELKLKVVKKYLKEEGSYKHLAKEYKISDESLIRKWVNNHIISEEEGLFSSRPNKEYALKLKLEALELY